MMHKNANKFSITMTLTLDEAEWLARVLEAGASNLEHAKMDSSLSRWAFAMASGLESQIRIQRGE